MTEWAAKTNDFSPSELDELEPEYMEHCCSQQWPRWDLNLSFLIQNSENFLSSDSTSMADESWFYACDMED